MKSARTRVTAVTLMTVAVALTGCGGGGSGGGSDEDPGSVAQPAPPAGLGVSTLPPNVSTAPVPVPTPSAPAAPVPGPTPGGSVPVTGSAETGAWSPTILPWTDVAGATVGKVLPLHAALLPDGRVLSYGQNTLGRHEFLYDVWQPPKGSLAGAEDPSRHIVLPTGISTHLFCSSQILVPSTGQLLISGGDIWNDRDGATPGTIGASNKGNNEANLFTPGSLTGSDRGGTMAPNAGGMAEGRWYATPTTLPNGEMYLQGGTDGNAVYGGGAPVTATRAEIRNPVTGAFRTLTGFNTVDLQNNYPRNWVAPDGRIFGWDHQQMYRIDWRGIGSRTTLQDTGIPWHNGWSPTSTAVMFRPGKILQVGGVEADLVNDPQASPDGLQTHIVDISDWTPGSAVTTAPPRITRGPDISQRRQWANATVLPDGKVVLMGGSEKNVLENPANNYANRGRDALFVEIFDPDANGGNGRWTRGPSQQRFRLYHSIALLLPNGTVLSAAGGWPGPADFFDGEIYFPPYLFNADGSFATRPTLDSVKEVGKPSLGSDVPHPVDPAQWIELDSPEAEDIQRITIVKTGSVTHSFNFEQRFLELGNVNDATKPILRSGSKLRVRLPVNPYETPPGYYMAFVIDGKGVPSEARIFLVNPA